MDRRRFLHTSAGLALGAAALPAFGDDSGPETLYNGIPMLGQWPPRVDALPAELPVPPYLVTPPAVIPIDVGRQLFVDDFLIQKTDLKRTHHTAEYHPATPVLRPDRDWEMPGGPTAMVFSDGVWHDPHDRLFKLWYMGGYTKSTCYATSHDGVKWGKPALDIRPGTNVIQTDGRDSTIIWLDHDEKDPARRYKLFRSHRLQGDEWGMSVYFSADGLHWGAEVARTGPCGDRNTAFYNPFRKRWVYSLRDGRPGPRRRGYWETSDLVRGPMWRTVDEPALWVGADRLDAMRDDLKTPCQLYNLDCVAYESLLLGLFTIWRGQPRDRAKPNEICVGYSRDGFHWSRPDRRAFIPVSERQGDWNWGNVQSAGGCCLVVGDKLYFYVSARAGVPGSTASGVCATGLATLRRDGFASLDAGDVEGALTTRPITFKGQHAFVNVAVANGELRAAVLDEAGREIRPFTRENSVPLHADGTKQALRWKSADSLERLAGRPVRFRFHLRGGSLYSFWVSPDKSGASHGYIAAGGPGFTNSKDTTGA